jgi:hypothetical protein
LDSFGGPLFCTVSTPEDPEFGANAHDSGKKEGHNVTMGDRKVAVPSPRRTSLKETPDCFDPIGSGGRGVSSAPSGNFQIAPSPVLIAEKRSGRPERPWLDLLTYSD